MKKLQSLADFMPLLRAGTLTADQQHQLAALLDHLVDLLRQRAENERQLEELRAQTPILLADFMATIEKN